MKKTNIILTLLIDERVEQKIEGTCNEENPNMSSMVEWWHQGCPSSDKVSLKSESPLNKSTLFEKYSSMMSYVKTNCPEKHYEIKMNKETIK